MRRDEVCPEAKIGVTIGKELRIIPRVRHILPVRAGDSQPESLPVGSEIAPRVFGTSLVASPNM